MHDNISILPKIATKLDPLKRMIMLRSTRNNE